MGDTYVHGGCCWRCGLQSNVLWLGRAGSYIPGWRHQGCLTGTWTQCAERAQTSGTGGGDKKWPNILKWNRILLMIRSTLIRRPSNSWDKAPLSPPNQVKCIDWYLYKSERRYKSYVICLKRNEITFPMWPPLKDKTHHPLCPPWWVSALEVLLLSNLFQNVSIRSRQRGLTSSGHLQTSWEIKEHGQHFTRQSISSFEIDLCLSQSSDMLDMYISKCSNVTSRLTIKCSLCLYCFLRWLVGIVGVTFR